MGCWLRPFLWIAAISLAAVHLPAYAAPGDRVALIIGNGAYAPGSTLASLPNAIGDAHLIHDRLRSLGFLESDIAVVENVSRPNFIHAIEQFRDRARDAHVAVVFYSGHGKEDTEGHPYLLPVDTADADSSMVQGYGVPLTFVVQALATEGRGAVRLFLIDACRTHDAMRGDSFGLSPGSLSDGMFIQTSTRGGAQASDGPTGGHSPYATAVDDVFRRPDLQGTSIKNIFDAIEDETAKSTAGRQDPQLTTQGRLSQSINLLGDFLDGRSDQILSAGSAPSMSEANVWSIVSQTDSIPGYTIYLQQYSFGAHSMAAHSRLAILSRASVQQTPPTDPLAEARSAMAALTANDWSILDDRSLLTKVIARASLPSIEQLANSGDAKATTIAAIAYRLGLGGAKPDYDKAERLYRSAAAAGEPYAQCDLGEILVNGEGGKVDQPKANGLINKAVAGGNIGCKSDLGLFYLTGMTVKKDVTQALDLLGQAADAGYAEAQYYLSQLYDGYPGVPLDEQRSYDYLVKSAAQGQSSAEGSLAEIRYDGAPDLHIAINEPEALRLAKLSAEQQDPSGQYLLGLFNLNGLAGLPKDGKEGLRLLRLSANAGHARAMLALSNLYADGVEVPKDTGTALEWVRKAAKTNNWLARLQLAKIEFNGFPGQPRAPEQALKELQALGAEGYGEAYYSLAIMVSNGWPGHAPDLEMADQLLKKAVDLQVPKAELEYARAHSGNSFSADYNPSSALETYKRLSDKGEPIAQFYLGEAYDVGLLNLKIDRAEGIRRIKLAADQHLSLAEFQLYSIYAYDPPTPAPSSEDTLHYLKAATADGSFDAEVELAWTYNDGALGLAKDANEALRLLRAAEGHGNPQAMVTMGVAYLSGNFGLTRSIPNAVEHFKMAVALSDPIAEFQLSGIYRDGPDGYPTNIPEAVHLLKLAADSGNFQAQTVFAAQLQYGVPGVKPDIAEAVRRLKIAAAEGSPQGQYDLALIYKYGAKGFSPDAAEADRLMKAAKAKGGYFEHETGPQKWVPFVSTEPAGASKI